MTYQETLEFLFTRTASYQQKGAVAFKKDLTNIVELCKGLNNPQHKFKSIHIGGTNGKGSTSHLLTSVFMEAGYKVGTYTSPHYLDFRERIKINGKEISEQQVIKFVELIEPEIERVQPSFFELTVAMAFYCFAQEQVDVAMIEVGLGGRLDSTNIINPELSIITNIGLDHQQFLGTTFESIATEKAGIIKPNTPVIIGRTQEETTSVFNAKARECNAPLYFADSIETSVAKIDWKNLTRELTFAETTVKTNLLANYQVDNIRTAFNAYTLLSEPFSIEEQHFIKGVEHVQKNSPIIGRWQVLNQTPLTIADSCHNEDGAMAFFNQIKHIDTTQLHIIYGCVSDKKVEDIKQYFPKSANVYITAPSVARRMPLNDLQQFFPEATTFESVGEAYNSLTTSVQPNDTIVVVGSIFLIADLLQHLQKN